MQMEGREGIAVAGGGHESGGHGMFRAAAADIAVVEAQEEAAKGYQSSPSTSPTPSPPPAAAAGHAGDAAATPLAWSLGGDKPSAAAGDNGMQTAGQSEHPASLSSGRRRGRPRGSGRRQILATLGQYSASKMQSFPLSCSATRNFVFFCLIRISGKKYVCSPCRFLLHCLDGVQEG
jgi:hypothetical protein